MPDPYYCGGSRRLLGMMWLAVYKSLIAAIAVVLRDLGLGCLQ